VPGYLTSELSDMFVGIPTILSIFHAEKKLN
jgi:hypothetical protein